MTIIQALILSIVEGITEFLPVSSTGHLILVGGLMKIPANEFVKTFEIAIQLGAVLAVVGVFGRQTWNNFKLWRKIAAAFVPTAIFGLMFYKPIKIYLLGNTSVVLWSLLLGGVVLIMFERFIKKGRDSIDGLNWKTAVGIGLAQSVSMVPGVSRAAATIVGGMLIGLSREEATKFSFLLAIPTMTAAVGLDIYKSGWNFDPGQFLILGVGFFGALVTAFVTTKYFIKYVQNHDFKIFGVYRIALALIFWWWR